MKIIHCADIHIGSVMQNLPADKAKIRKRELIDSFFRMLDFARENNVKVIIIAGDFYDVRKIARSTRKEILETVSAFPKIDFLYLTGNHDNKMIIEENELTAPANLHKFDKQDEWDYFSYENVCIAGIDIEKQRGYGFYEKLNFDKSKINIAVMHGDLKTVQIDKLKGKYIDYLALGDIHIPDIEPKKLDSRGIYGYSGCLEGRGYDESGDKGFFLLEIDNNKLTREFHSIAKRKYEIVEMDITNLDSHSKIDNALKAKLSAIDKENIVKVVLTGKRKADTQIEKENLEKKLNEKFFHAKVKDQSILDMTSVEYLNEISLRSEFVNIVKKSNLTNDEKDKVIEYGIKSLLGEEIDL